MAADVAKVAVLSNVLSDHLKAVSMKSSSFLVVDQFYR